MSANAHDLEAVDLPELLGRLEMMGMDLGERRHAEQFIRRMGFNLFEAYSRFKLAEVKRNKPPLYRPGTTLQHIEQAIAFDQQLKDHAIKGTRVIELWLRSTLAYETSRRFGDPCWHMNDLKLSEYATAQRKKLQNWRRTIKEAETTLNVSEGSPLWMISMHVGFGFWWQGYDLLSTAEKVRIADLFALQPSTLENWLLQIVGVRNICSHHMVLWSASMSAMSYADGDLHTALLKSVKISSSGRLEYPSMRFYAIHHILTRIDPQMQDWADQLKEIVANAPLLSLLGFQVGWEQQAEWK